MPLQPNTALGSYDRVRRAVSADGARIAEWEPVNQSAQYAVSRDGRRTVVNTATDAVRSLGIVLNWPALATR